MNDDQIRRMRDDDGFIAALDQSGGSTPKALRLYGIEEDAYAGDEEMFDLVHEMRSRIITSPAFAGERILAAILFEKTMDRQVDGVDTAAYLWERKGIIPILKVDKGLADEGDGVRLMKPLDDLDGLLERATAKGIFGTKMRSVIERADEAGIAAVVAQQFQVAQRIGHAGLVPIIEPEVDINAPDKEDAEDLLLAAIRAQLQTLPEHCPVMFKLTIPTRDDLYAELTEHPAVLRVVALSGGYSRAEACERLARNRGVVASFSRALTEGLRVDQSEEEFDETLAASIEEIYRASVT